MTCPQLAGSLAPRIKGRRVCVALKIAHKMNRTEGAVEVFYCLGHEFDVKRKENKTKRIMNVT